VTKQQLFFDEARLAVTPIALRLLFSANKLHGDNHEKHKHKHVHYRSKVWDHLEMTLFFKEKQFFQ